MKSIKYRMSACVQPAAVESRYVCHIHQQHDQSTAPDHHHDNGNLASRDRQLSTADVDDGTTSGRRAMTSSGGQLERRTGERTMMEDGQEEVDAAADADNDDDDDDDDDNDDEPVWIARSPRHSTSGDAVTWPPERRLPDVSPPFEPEVLRPDDVRLRRRTTTTKDESTSGCPRAHALFVWKRAIVEWRAISAVIDRLLFFIFLAATACLLYTSPSPRDRQKSRMPSSA